MAHGSGGITAKIREYSVPLIVGVIAALIVANIDSHAYHELIEVHLFGLSVFGHEVTPHFLINDIFMVFFFGVAMFEITEAILPGGALNPPSRAINPLLGTLGGVLGPVGVFFVLTHLIFSGADNFAQIANGWGIPTATDIALAWLCARLVFGAKHPAVNFLLLLAVADDAIGLGIIAVFYPDPAHPVQPALLLCTAGAMVLAFALRRARVSAWWPYIFLAGGLSWYGLLEAHLHPALALVFVVPFLPASREGPSPLSNFEHAVKPTVDWGLFFFAFANAGAEFSAIGTMTWIILASLVIGKTLGVTAFSAVASKIGFPLPKGMDLRTLITAGLVAGLGLTVALFVAGQAYVEPVLRAEAKMGAVFSAAVFGLALLLGRALRVQRMTESPPPKTEEQALHAAMTGAPDAGQPTSDPAARAD